MTPVTAACRPWNWPPPLPGPRSTTAAPTSPVAAAIDTVAGVRQFEISGPINAPLGRSNNYPRSVANRIGADPARAILEIVGGQGPQHLISELAAEIAAGRSEVALIFGSDATSTLRHFAKAETKPDFTETVDGDAGRPRPGHGGTRLAVHRHSRSDQCANPIRAAGERPTGRNRARPGRVPAADGRAVRAVHQDRCQESVRRRAGGTHRRRTDHRDRAQPDDLGAVPAAAGRPRSGEPGRGRAADVGRGGTPAGGARGELGVPARARRHGRAVAAGAPGPRAFPVGRDGGARGAGHGRHRHRRHRHLRPVQLLPGAGIQHLRRHGNRDRRSARADADRWAAVLRRRRQQLLDARRRRNSRPDAKRARAIRARRRQRRHPEQVLGRHLLRPRRRNGSRTAARSCRRRSPAGPPSR